MNLSTLNPIHDWLAKNRIPRPIFYFFAVLLLLIGINSLIGAGGSKPKRIASAVSEGLMSIFHDDEGLRNLVLIFTKDGKNDDGTAEIRSFGAGLGRMFFGGGGARAGGDLYFTQYQQEGVTLTGGPLNVEVSNVDYDGEVAARYRVQGDIQFSGSDQPAYVQLEFISPKKTYDVVKLTGQVKINGTITDL